MLEAATSALHYSLLDEPLIRWRDAADGQLHSSSLPALLAALAADQVRDFPALRPHQRHVWHAFLTQLAVIALNQGDQTKPWTQSADWRAALLALAPDDPDGAPWCLVAPPDRPALLQPPVPGEDIAKWKNTAFSADQIDMLITAKNHDLKAARARHAQPDEWLFALVSLQTQEGFLGAGNYGISRMNGGFANRPGVGVAPIGRWGARWRADIQSLLARRASIAEQYGLALERGHVLLWLLPWDGSQALALETLDPFYIEICRRVRLIHHHGSLQARATGSKVARVAGKDRKGVTGDAWTPVDTGADSAMTPSGFDYKRTAELLAGARFTHGAAWRLTDWPSDAKLQMIACATVRGQGKTEGYHERRVAISPRLRRLLAGSGRVAVAQIANQRIQAISDMRSLLWAALVTLFSNGQNTDSGKASDAISSRAGLFARAFEQAEDTRFFIDLALEAEAEPEQRHGLRLRWLLGLAGRAEQVLKRAFATGPRSAQRRYKARALALRRFHGALRSTSNPAFPDLSAHYAEQRLQASAEPEEALS